MTGFFDLHSLPADVHVLNTPTLVADITLARRLERVEALSNAEFVEVRAAAFPDLGGCWIDVAGAYAMFDGADSPCTQTFGLGLFEYVTVAHMEELEKFFHDRHSDVFHEVCPMADMSLIQLLNERGYRPVEFSNLLFRTISSDLDLGTIPEEPIRGRTIEPGEEEIWVRTAALGWKDVAPELDDYFRELIPVLQHRRNTHYFLAEKQGQAIAAAALCLFAGVALLAGACTIPEWRQQGAQRALLERRLRCAADQNCDLAMIVAQPGSASQRNAERQGFRVAYTRIKWRLTRPST